MRRASPSRAGALCLALAITSPVIPWVNAQENIGALGRILPVGGIVDLPGHGGTIERILVKPEQVVKAGDELLHFSGKLLQEIELELARSKLAETEAATAKAVEVQEHTLAKLDQTTAKEIDLQKIKIAAAAETANYTSRVLRRLLNSGAESFSANLRSENEHMAESARINLDIAKAEINRLSIQRERELSLANLELDRLKAQQTRSVEQARMKVKLAEAQVQRAMLIAPTDGTILEILHHEGEAATGTILRMADLRHMAVHADVFQADVLRVKPGMTATITSKAVSLNITGVVASEGRIISEQSHVARTVIHLTDPGPAAELLNLEVEVSLSAGP